MPLLPSEPPVFPEHLFAEDMEGVMASRSWWVVHTRPRQEKSLARALRERQVSYYLPTIARCSRLRGRRLVSHIPLFPGYLFLLARPEERQTALATQRVARCLNVLDQRDLWRDLRQIYRLISTGAPLTPEDRLAVGSRVEICSGPLAGLQGVIVRTAKGRRFVVQVDFIQRGASVLLDDVDLRPLPSR